MEILCQESVVVTLLKRDPKFIPNQSQLNTTNRNPYACFLCISNINPKLQWFSDRFAVVSTQYIEVRYLVENEDVVGAAPTCEAPTASEWSTILLPTKDAPYIRDLTVAFCGYEGTNAGLPTMVEHCYSVSMAMFVDWSCFYWHHGAFSLKVSSHSS